MGKKWSILIVLFVALTMLLIMAGNIAASPREKEKEGPITLTFMSWWAAYEDAFLEVIDKYEAANPNVDIVWRALGYGDYIPAWKAALAAEEGVDIFPIYPVSMIVELVKAGQILDLTPYAEKYGWIKDTKPAYLAPLYWEGKLYSVPGGGNNLSMIYRPDIFEQNNIKVPTTLNEWIAISPKLNNIGIVPISMPGNAGWVVGDLFFQVAAQTAGSELLRKADLGEVSWENPEIVEAFRIIAKMRDANLFGPDLMGIDLASSWKMIWDGKAAANFNMCSCFIAEWNKAFPEIDWSLYKGMLFPQVKDAAIPRAIGSYSFCYSITSFSPHKEEAIRFVDFLLKPENVETILKYSVDLPPYKKFDAESIVEEKPKMRDIFMYFVSVDDDKSLREIFTPEINEALITGVQQLLSGQLTPEEVAAYVQKASESGTR
jgi:raffinose/stachyose/melibiose transport system substrate-binding protein